MSKRMLASKSLLLSLALMPSMAFAQVWTPGSEIVGQSLQVQTNGVTNTVYLDPGGAARIISPGGSVVNASWTANAGRLCLNTGAGAECWPYTQAFQAGQPVTLVSSCQATSTWVANATNTPPPTTENMGERG